MVAVDIPVTLPARWRAVHMFDNDPKIVIIMAPTSGAVTVDLRRRNYALGIGIVHESRISVYNRRGWEVTLFGQAIAALKTHITGYCP